MYQSIWVPVALFGIISFSLLGLFQVVKIRRVIVEILQMKKEEKILVFKRFFKIPVEWKIEEHAFKIQLMVTQHLKNLAEGCQQNIIEHNSLLETRDKFGCDISEEVFNEARTQIEESGRSFLDAHDMAFDVCAPLKVEVMGKKRGFKLSRSFRLYLGSSPHIPPFD